MRYLHTMVRVSDLDQALDFYCAKLGLKEVRRLDNEKGRFTLVFLCAPGDLRAEGGAAPSHPLVELTFNWDRQAYAGGRNFGHLAYASARHLRAMREIADGRRDHQPAAA